MSQDIDEQLKVAHNLTDVVERADRKVCATLLQNNVYNSDNSNAQDRIFAWRKEYEKFQQVVYVK